MEYPTDKQKELIGTLGDQILELIKCLSENLNAEYYEKIYGTAKYLNIKKNSEVSDLICSMNRVIAGLYSVHQMIANVKKGNEVSPVKFESIEKWINKNYRFVEEYIVLPGLELVIDQIKKELEI